MCAYPPFEMQNSSDVAHFVLKIFGFAQFEVKSFYDPMLSPQLWLISSTIIHRRTSEDYVPLPAG